MKSHMKMFQIWSLLAIIFIVLSFLLYLALFTLYQYCRNYALVGTLDICFIIFFAIPAIVFIAEAIINAKKVFYELQGELDQQQVNQASAISALQQRVQALEQKAGEVSPGPVEAPEEPEPSVIEPSPITPEPEAPEASLTPVTAPEEVPTPEPVPSEPEPSPEEAPKDSPSAEPAPAPERKTLHFCPRCGNKIDLAPDDDFCPVCGEKIRK